MTIFCQIPWHVCVWWLLMSWPHPQSLLSSSKFVNRFCLTILIRLRFSRLVVHLFFLSSFFLWHSTEAVAFFHSPSSPLFSLLAPFVSSHLLRDSLCTALQTERLWIWSTGLSTQLTPSSLREAGVLGNLTALTERSQLAIRWTCGRGGESYV